MIGKVGTQSRKSTEGNAAKKFHERDGVWIAVFSLIFLVFLCIIGILYWRIRKRHRTNVPSPKMEQPIKPVKPPIIKHSENNVNRKKCKVIGDMRPMNRLVKCTPLRHPQYVAKSNDRCEAHSRCQPILTGHNRMLTNVSHAEIEAESNVSSLRSFETGTAFQQKKNNLVDRRIDNHHIQTRHPNRINHGAPHSESDDSTFEHPKNAIKQNVPVIQQHRDTSHSYPQKYVDFNEIPGEFDLQRVYDRNRIHLEKIASIRNRRYLQFTDDSRCNFARSDDPISDSTPIDNFDDTDLVRKRDRNQEIEYRQTIKNKKSCNNSCIPLGFQATGRGNRTHIEEEAIQHRSRAWIKNIDFKTKALERSVFELKARSEAIGLSY